MQRITYPDLDKGEAYSLDYKKKLYRNRINQDGSHMRKVLKAECYDREDIAKQAMYNQIKGLMTRHRPKHKRPNKNRNKTTTETLADRIGISLKKYKQALQIIRYQDPRLLQLVTRHRITISEAYKYVTKGKILRGFRNHDYMHMLEFQTIARDAEVYGLHKLYHDRINIKRRDAIPKITPDYIIQTPLESIRTCRMKIRRKYAIREDYIKAGLSAPDIQDLYYKPERPGPYAIPVKINHGNRYNHGWYIPIDKPRLVPRGTSGPIICRPSGT